jgi:hypothetical protein
MNCKASSSRIRIRQCGDKPVTTDEQKTQLDEILSKYDPENMTDNTPGLMKS